MKAILITLILTLGMTVTAQAGKAEKVTLRIGQQKTAVRGDLKIKFLAVPEDSRCPVNANCIWAGNAKVRIKVTDRRGLTKTFEVNTTQGPQGDQFGGYAITISSLTPQPGTNGRIDGSRYRLVLSVERLTR